MKVFYDMEVNLLIKTFEVLCLFTYIYTHFNKPIFDWKLFDISSWLIVVFKSRAKLQTLFLQLYINFKVKDFHVVISWVSQI